MLAELGALELVPEISLPDPRVRAERELARFRMHLVKQRTMLKNRIHQTLIAHGVACPVSDLFGVGGRRLLDRAELPVAWRASTDASLRLIEQLDAEIDACVAELRRQNLEHPYVPLLVTAPGIGPILGYTIASELGDIGRFASAAKLVGYTGLCPRVYQSGERDRRGRLAKNGPNYLRWALIEAAVHAGRSVHYRDLYQRTRAAPAASAAPPSPTSPSPESSPKRSGGCSPASSGLPRQAPPRSDPSEGPRVRYATGAAPITPDHPTRGCDREMSNHHLPLTRDGPS